MNGREPFRSGAAAEDVKKEGREEGRKEGREGGETHVNTRLTSLSKKEDAAKAKDQP